MKSSIIPSAILALYIVFTAATGWASQPLSVEECRVIVKDFERMSNLNPEDVESQAPEVLAKLHNGETLTSYFVAFNIYVENLFNKGNVEKARQEIDRMLGEAMERPYAECKVIALRTQGQFYYKLGLYDRAADCFRRGMEICPRYDSEELDHCFTWSSTLFWLVQSDLHINRVEEAEQWMHKMDGMMKWLEKKGEKDQVGYKPVMIRGLKAKIALQKGKEEEAEALIAECPQFMQKDIPDRAYVEYYVAQMQLYLKRGKHSEALPLLDRLIEIHIDDYKPIAAEFIRQKGVSLAEVGRFEESSRALTEYIELEKQLNDLALGQQLDELTTRYEVEKLQHERDNMRRQLLIVVAICLAMAIIFTLIVVNQKKMRQKNRALAHHISELNRLDREGLPAAEGMEENPVEDSNSELVRTGNKIVDYIHRTRCYLRADCSRDTIKEGVGVSDHVLAKAVVAATGISFVNYINQLRLKVSIGMLEENKEMAINDISAACGFGSVRQFQRIFKQHYNLSPSAYREAFINTDTNTNI